MRTFYSVLSVLCLTLILGAFQNCAPMHEGVNSSSSQGGVSQENLLKGFSSTLYPTVRSACSGCHGAGQVPMFAVANDLDGMNTIFQHNLVDLSNPSNSKMVQKIRGGHNGFASSLADQIEGDIQNWAVFFNAN